MEVKVKKEKCIGCGACAAICPDVFEMGDEGKSVVKEKETDKDCAKEAADSCPTDAIIIN